MSRCNVRRGEWRCLDTSGVAHGHWFRPDVPDPDLCLTREEANELVRYMRHEFLNPNHFPRLTRLLDRLDEGRS